MLLRRGTRAVLSAAADSCQGMPKLRSCQSTHVFSLAPMLCLLLLLPRC